MEGKFCCNGGQKYFVDDNMKHSHASQISKNYQERSYPCYIVSFNLDRNLKLYFSFLLRI